MVEIQGKSIIDWQIETAKSCGIQNIIVVTGFCSESVKANATLIENPKYDTTNMVQSLWCAKEHFSDEIIISYGDILYSENVLSGLLNQRSDSSITIDLDFLKYWQERCDNPLDDLESLQMDENDNIIKID